jgi:hypothetical protein
LDAYLCGLIIFDDQEFAVQVVLQLSRFFLIFSGLKAKLGLSLRTAAVLPVLNALCLDG